MIPLSTTLIAVARLEPAVDTDPYDPNPPSPTVVASAVRAVIAAPTANTALSGGDRVVYSAGLRCDPCPIEADDTVTDSAGTVWQVLWARRVTAVGQDLVEGQLRLVTGAS